MFTPHAPLNRVPSGCSTGVESLGLFPWGSLPSSGFRPRNSEMLHAPCAMLAIPLGLYCSKKKSFQKLHQLSVGGAFLRLFW